VLCDADAPVETPLEALAPPDAMGEPRESGDFPAEPLPAETGTPTVPPAGSTTMPGNSTGPSGTGAVGTSRGALAAVALCFAVVKLMLY
jgi:hypothetical protein